MLIESNLTKWLVPSGARFLAAGAVAVGVWASDGAPRHAHHKHLRAIATPVPTAVAPAPRPVVVAATATPGPVATRAAAQATPTPTPTPSPTPTPTPLPSPPCAYEDANGCQVTEDECTIRGTLGDDMLLGTAMVDLICGFGGNDTIDGGGGDDTIYGGPGDDTITGGTGSDCMAGGPGSDTFPDAQPGDTVAADTLPGGTVGPDGRCRPHVTPGTGGSGGGGGGPAPTPTPTVIPGEEGQPRNNESSSDLTVTAQTGSVALAIAQALQGSEPDVTIGDTATVKDGVANLFLECGTPVSGTVVLVVKRGKKQQRAGSSPFSCDPPSTVVKVKLKKSARSRLHDAGTLNTTAKVSVNDAQVAAEKVVLTEAAG